MYQEPVWVAEARRAYAPELVETSSETSFGRGQFARKTLSRYVLPRFEDDINILVVGAGLDTKVVYCPVEPYLISGFLQSKKRDYRMTVIDKDPKVIGDLHERRNVFVADSSVQSIKDGWNLLLKYTGQRDDVVHELVEGLEMTPFSNMFGQQQRYFDSGIRRAEIPGSFREKLDSGEVKLMNDDIATADLLSHGPFDFISCENVLYLISEEGQKLAMHNISRNIRQGGMILFNDFWNGIGSRVLPDSWPYKGWFDKEKQAELGLRHKKTFEGYGKSYWVVFEKIS
ncbi:MAG: hypothetical protein HY513_02900 [Candidatus Aenigmarchaeota archaeon]|nr:hypothetical protein [Candidatus Aenigmarchaeota archaeon]